jgi:hypothetical protein
MFYFRGPFKSTKAPSDLQTHINSFFKFSVKNLYSEDIPELSLNSATAHYHVTARGMLGLFNVKIHVNTTLSTVHTSFNTTR